MNTTSNRLDLSSVITQVPRDDDDQHNRSIALVTAAGTNEASSTAQQTQNRKTRSERIVSFLLCCLGGSCRSQSRQTTYISTRQVDSEHEELNPDGYIGYESHEKPLLPTIRDIDRTKICLVIDLDETLVHSVFRPVPNADFVVPVEIEGQVHQIYVSKRPHVDEFLRCVGELFECVLFTASLAKYADPVADLLDTNRIFRSRLFREACTLYNGNYIKDLSRLGRDIRRVIIIDNSPVSFLFHHDNAVPVASWFDDIHDTELLTLIPVFERLATVDNVIPALQDIHQRRATV